MKTKTLTKIQPLTFSGIPVVCRHCGKPVDRRTYQKSLDGSYLCESCYEASLMIVNKVEVADTNY